MKTNKFITALMLLTASCTAFSFSSCNKDDDDDIDIVDALAANDLNALSKVQGVTVSGIADGYTYVDLGLASGKKWATYNVGAGKPSDYGDYFTWGETSPKDYYYTDSYKWYNSDGRFMNHYTKYTTVLGFAYNYVLDSLTVLTPDDDAATANWGSLWMMPTKDDLDELLDGCNWVWTDNFNNVGVSGFIGYSKVNQNTIFLPAAGCMVKDSLNRAGDELYYNSSSLNINDNGRTRNYHYTLDSSRWYDQRYYGYSVRAILK